MCTKHKHYKLIVAWSEGAKIQVRNLESDEWYDADTPLWWNDREYRIKPEPKPDVVLYSFVPDNTKAGEVAIFTNYKTNYQNIKIVVDGETGKLKSVEKI